ncbi:hypothetical protein GYMLUDRAFT_43088 [Collybiopsis luxurians FD-317 M1]|uniref:Uncharacterized protein n=1 Tax=Collybiopsis luxurians FD-317 M1 TaxID=944289 RepID=A0A0D0CR06_9AGAR|nr:hypothetical protein GYMLUDRAFT_43088 [Collybiopsis luxurians FD-317 M1]
MPPCPLRLLSGCWHCNKRPPNRPWVQEYQAASHNFMVSTVVYQVPAEPTLLPMSICPITSCQPVSAIYGDVNIHPIFPIL